jgi:hypothetical protein
MAQAFKHVGGVRVKRSVFDLSHEHKLTCDMGQLIPVMCEEVYPGDVFKFGHEIVVRFQPLVAPVLHEINVVTHSYFVPYRLLWSDWEKFITGGPDGNDDSVIPNWNLDALPRSGDLWDYFGFPMKFTPLNKQPKINAFPFRAYYFIWNEYYRDEDLQEELPWFELDSYPDPLDYNQRIPMVMQNMDTLTTPSGIMRRNWEKDYFTVARPFRQKGDKVAIPITGIGQVDFDGAVQDLEYDHQLINEGTNATIFSSNVSSSGFSNVIFSNGGDWQNAGIKTVYGSNFKAWLEQNHFDFSQAATFDIADLRAAFQVQKWKERNARAGSRYTEFITAHFGKAPRDERLDRPEYIGGTFSPLVISEVLQTAPLGGPSGEETPSANMSGHGLSADRTSVGSYAVKEHGLIMTVLSVMPRTAYDEAVDRMWQRETRYDYYFPEFAHLSEQAVLRKEVHFTGDAAKDDEEFGYQGIYDELRYRRSSVHAEMRDTFHYWHLGRELPDNVALNNDFIKCKPDKNIFAVENVHGLIVNVGNRIKAIRPMPVIADPGLLDHF